MGKVIFINIIEYRDKYFTSWKLRIVTDNGTVVDLQHSVRSDWFGRLRETFDQLDSFNNSYAISSIDTSRLGLRYPNNSIVEGSNQISHLNTLYLNYLENAIYSALNFISSYSICIKGILSVGSFFLISNYLIPFINRIMQKSLKIFSLFLDRFIIYIKSAVSGQKSSKRSYNKKNGTNTNKDVNKGKISFILNGDNNDDDEDEFNKRNPEHFSFSPHALEFLTRAQIERLVAIIRIFLNDVTNNRFPLNSRRFNPSRLNEALIFNHITEFNDILDILNRAILEGNIPSNSWVYRIHYTLTMLLNMIRRVEGLYNSVNYNQIGMERLNYFTIPGQIQPGIWNPSIPWNYLYNTEYIEEYNFSIPLTNVNHNLPRGFVLVYSERYWISILTTIINNLITYLEYDSH